MGAHSVIRDARTTGHEAKNHPVIDGLSRGGFVAYGLVYILMAWLGLQLAFGDREGKVSKNGALHELAAQPLGKGLLWAVAVGLAALVVRTALEAVVGHRHKQGAERWAARGGNVVQMVIYGALGLSAAKVAMGSSSNENPDSLTAKLFQLPLGTWIVGAIGLGVMAYAVVSVWRGLGDGYKDDLDPRALTGTKGRLLTVLGTLGFCSRGVAFGIIGGLFVWAAATQDAKESAGLDGALSRLLDAPLGPALLAVVAFGFACYGLFNVVRARYPRR